MLALPFLSILQFSISCWRSTRFPPSTHGPPEEGARRCEDPNPHALSWCLKEGRERLVPCAGNWAGCRCQSVPG